jgi:pyruvate dehydrogenase E1 component beta subunit
MSMPETVATARTPGPSGSGIRELTFGEAIREALAEEMRRDPRVVLLGEDVAEAGTPFKVLKGLVEEFGKDRVVDTPISEAGFTGLAVGAAMAGLRPVVDIMFGDFLALIMDQVVNQAAKIHYMSGGKWKVPMVVRATMGATRRSAAQHSQSLHAWPSHIPGLKVAIPSTPYDAKGLLKAAIRDDNPVVIFEDKISYAKVKGPVPDEDYVIPLGVADIKREGRDISLVATSSMVQVALGAAAMLEEIGISAEVVDPRTTWPLDEKTLIESVRKTSRCIVVDEGYYRYGHHGRNRVGHRGGRVLRFSTVPCGGSAPGTCRCRSRRRSRMRPCLPNATSSRWRDRCATNSGPR